MITKNPWFGPKKGFGWGWTPISWQGWALTIACLATMFAALFVFGRAPMTNYIVVGAVIVLVLACVLTGEPPSLP